MYLLLRFRTEVQGVVVECKHETVATIITAPYRFESEVIQYSDVNGILPVSSIY